MDLSFKDVVCVKDDNITDRLKFDIETKQDVDTAFEQLRKINYTKQGVSIVFTRKTPRPD
jgi:hypothetical protein